MDDTVDEKLDLQTAADLLGVHYQTAYRWVRTGALTAQLVGASYAVDPADVRALAESRRLPRNPPTPTTLRLERAADRVYETLVVGDDAATGRHVRRLVEEGASITDVIQEVLVPPLVRIGQDWSDGKIAIWTEHRAATIVERLLGELTPNPRGRRRGMAVVAAVSDERHSLPTTMAAAALREHNWQVHNLGANTPAAQLIEFCHEHEVTVAVISVTIRDDMDRAASTAEVLRAAGTPTIVGGPGRTLVELVDEARRVRTIEVAE